MTSTRTASVLLAIAAAGLLVTGSAGFTGANADRGVSVSVADDPNAFIGYDAADQTVTDGETIQLVEMENRLPGGASVAVADVLVEPGSFSISEVTEPSLSAGRSDSIDGRVTCTPGQTQTVAVTVRLQGNGMQAELFGDTRAFQLTCAADTDSGPSLDGASFTGAGNFELNAPGVSETNITYWTGSQASSEFAESKLDDFDTSEALQKQTKGGATKAVAVYVPEFDVTFYHPNFDIENGTMGTSWGQGTDDATRRDGPPDFA